MTPSAETTIMKPNSSNDTADIVHRHGNLELLNKPEIKKIMDSDVAINALLSRLKTSLLTCEEFTKFLRKKYLYEDEHTQELSKQYKHFFMSSSGSSLKRMIHDILEYDGKLAHVKQSYIRALQKMYDEISALLLTITKMRKTLKENSRRLEKDVSDAIHSAEKAQSRYNSLCQDWDKLRMSDPTKTKLTLRGSKTTREQEEELLRKIDIADLEYKQKVDHSNSLRNTFITKERPRIVLELKDLILELDTAMAIQVQKYTIWTENLVLNSGVTISPFDKSSRSMKQVASSVTTEKDLYNFLNKYNHSGKNSLLVNRNLIPVDYKKHPSMNKNTNVNTTNKPLKYAVDPSRNSIPKRTISTHNESPFISNSTSFTNPSQQGRNVSFTPSLDTTASSNFAPLNRSTTDGKDIRNTGADTSSFQSLDPGKQVARIPTSSTALTEDSDRPISHVQTNTTMPPGTQTNFKTFGVPLESLIEYEQDMVPAIVRQCIYVIDQYGLELEGIYRKSANVLDVSRLKEEIDKDPANVSMILPPKNYSDSDIYLVASLLKAFFASLSEPLLPNDMSPDIMTCIAIEDLQTRKNYMHGLIYKLPDAQYWTLRSLLFHLKRILSHEEQNRMNLKSVCIIWGPTIIPPNQDDINDVNYQIKAMEVLIDAADQAFEPEK
ncbi:hypothetical protein KAFR_0C04350 [Kazachstania africana CBS 2517]|uniref:Rho-GAP domain-containing protein n=1 Tax=Kazachstania africana (strain ATCC 22294 / BCRC 22015 / CBS 2517 / CECT 1963 / NBRC 1671 / NRRL Y-8276) TaxID=1071382 RepID=H2ASS5_KAZAF|nr:hypothetical protein KAFR_0C04350 [Kazachstania africana CBS 2517]CCF57425.1 hypothetical protein KAFR_0C04350 [Kazachstania africana CBS 2517]